MKYLWKDQKHHIEPNEKAFFISQSIESSHYLNPHNHDFYELFWVESGTAEHYVNDQKFVLESGDIYFIRPEDCHSFRIKRKQSLVLSNLAFPISEMKKLSHVFPGKMDKTWISTHKLPLSIKISESCCIEKIKILSSILFAKQIGSLELQSFVGGFLSIISEFLERDPEEIKPDWLEKLLFKLEKDDIHSNKDWSWESLSGYNSSHVSRTFQKYLKTSPSQYLRKLRINKGRRLLSTSNLSIVEIAYQCGFSNSGHFLTAFQKEVGTSPSRYRKEKLKSII